MGDAKLSERSRAQMLLTPREVAKACLRQRGILSRAAQKLGVTRRTVWNYAQRYRGVRNAIAEGRARRLDRAEDQLDRAVSNGEPWAVCFTLKMRGQRRGYMARKSVSHRHEHVMKFESLAAEVRAHHGETIEGRVTGGAAPLLPVQNPAV